MNNPLLTQTALPPFKHINAAHAVPAIESLIAQNKQAIKQLEQLTTPTWANLVQPLEDMASHLQNAWAPVQHLNNVCNDPKLREAYQACLELLSQYHSEVGQNAHLYQLFVTLKNQANFTQLTTAQQKVITDTLQDFELSGVALDEAGKARYRDIQQALAKLTNQFENNILDSTDAWYKQITDETLLAGIPLHATNTAKEEAKRRDLTGWVFTLEFPSYYAIINYADSRQLREEFYTAYNTRASDQGPNAGKWDNSAVMEQILALRHELALLLGFKNYAELSLATKMVKSPEQVLHFLFDLIERAKPQGLAEITELKAFAEKHYGIHDFAAWDSGYFSEKLKAHSYELDNESLRPYFPENVVIAGLFTIVNKLYSITIKADETIETWHPDVKAYRIYNSQQQPIAMFYFDLYARANKRGGAWMDDCRARHLDAKGQLQLPVAFLTCNFTKPQNEATPALFTHDEVLTLFHEFGHGLHHLLTQIDTISISGINGVEWDAVELPSQFMENFCWERHALDLISGHFQTGIAIPDDLYQKMLKAKNYHSAIFMLRQLEFSLFDFRLYLEYSPEKGGRVQQFLDEARAQVELIPVPSFNRFAHSFSHIFAGGYAAGYYSYKWAEVLSSDAYSLFEETDIFSQNTGQAFLQKLLSQGGSKPAAELFKDFRGRDPRIDAYLRHNGLV